MRIEENAGGGDTVVVEPRDKLASVPASHRELLSPEIRDAFRDPASYFAALAGRCPFHEMSRWLGELLTGENWKLELNRGSPFDERVNWTMAGFRWESRSVKGALIGPPGSSKPPRMPAALDEYYAIVSVVHWSIFGAAGGLYSGDKHIPVTQFPHYCRNLNAAAESVFIWGSSGNGDMLVHAHDDRGGMLAHETGRVHWLGTIAESINSIFGQLVGGKEPQYDYENWK